MDKYYVIECVEPAEWSDCASIAVEPEFDFDTYWMAGMKFEAPLPEPLEFELDENHNDQLLEMYNDGPLIISKRLLEALLEAGVDNLDVYETVIRHPQTGFETKDYVAVNIIGTVLAADLSKSEVAGGSADHLIDTDFNSLAIDDARAKGLLMFRLAESVDTIVAHEKVKNHVMAKGFIQIIFVDPEDWIT